MPIRHEFVHSKLREPVKQLLSRNRHVWDHAGQRDTVRKNFDNIAKCKEPELGYEVFSSATEEIRVPHTCKARGCSPCGFRKSLDWVEHLDATLPDITYTGIVFTMPRAFWKMFQQNRHLLRDLPTLAAMVVQEIAEQDYGAEVLFMAVPHTFGAHLNFNCHVHTLVSAGGLRKSDGKWIKRLDMDKDTLMPRWRYLVVTYLREAIKAGVLTSERSTPRLLSLVAGGYGQSWNVDLSPSYPKRHYIEYSGRYVHRPPIAQYRFAEITEETVTFWIKDKIEGWINRTCSIEEFIGMLAEHVPEQYQNQVRYYGLLSPRSKARTLAGLLTLFRQEEKPKPKRLTWQELRIQSDGIDPLIDSHGLPMQWSRQVAPPHIHSCLIPATLMAFSAVHTVADHTCRCVSRAR